jgi:hypothetical protein
MIISEKYIKAPGLVTSSWWRKMREKMSPNLVYPRLSTTILVPVSAALFVLGL